VEEGVCGRGGGGVSEGKAKKKKQGDEFLSAARDREKPPRELEIGGLRAARSSPFLLLLCSARDARGRFDVFGAGRGRDRRADGGRSRRRMRPTSSAAAAAAAASIKKGVEVRQKGRARERAALPALSLSRLLSLSADEERHDGLPLR
jgi:hypothetical protein